MNKSLEKYNCSLKQKYSAVCLDIDGTITKLHSKQIDERIIVKLEELVTKRIPIVFITGRGESGLDALKSQLSSSSIIMQNSYLLFALINDGSRLVQSVSNALLNKIENIIPDKYFDMLTGFNQEYVPQLLETYGDNVCVTYSYNQSLSSPYITNIRIQINNDILREKLYNKIADDLRINYSLLNISEGKWQEYTILQIGTTTKDTAIKNAEKILGIPENSMIRIGDCGNECGNDYAMLNCSQGFSTNKCSKDEESCFPIMDEYGNILTGVEGTLYLLDKAKILSTICLESRNSEFPMNYRIAYSKKIKDLKKENKRYIDKYNCIVNNLFEVDNGIYSLCDVHTGAICFEDYEWILLEDNYPLKNVFNYYLLEDNNKVLLRGSDTYYYFLAKRYDYVENGKSITFTSFENVIEWFDNYLEFNYKVLDALKNTNDISDIYNKRLLLGVLDNLRNELLLIMNYLFMENDNTLFINLEALATDSLLYRIYNNLIAVDKNIIHLSLNDNHLSKKEIIFNIEETVHCMLACRDMFSMGDKLIDYSKKFRAFREIDNILENVITIDLANKHNSFNNDNHILCGLSYGGIELPIIQKALYPEYSDVCIFKFGKNIHGYKNTHATEIRNFDINDYGGLELVHIDKLKKVILMDDNVLTGKSLQLAINAMYDNAIYTDKVVVVRYPEINRISQMFIEGHGAVDYNCFCNFINGLCFPTPYSKIDKYSQDKYEDSLGIFDLQRRKILELLYKNGSYNEKGEVNKIFIKKRKSNESN